MRERERASVFCSALRNAAKVSFLLAVKRSESDKSVDSLDAAATAAAPSSSVCSFFVLVQCTFGLSQFTFVPCVLFFGVP